ncbi:hypothetical protein ACR77J_15860 [Tissierella praeacuta]|uniref:hypothetical protein n=1 Tax=Tissierella praeacuta TaxID=43131 RepID=UPI003DA22F38
MKKCTDCIHYRENLEFDCYDPSHGPYAECLIGSVEFSEFGSVFQDVEDIGIDCDFFELTICHDTLDKKVNEEETLRDFIKNSYKYFYEEELTDEKIESQTEESLKELVEHLDYLWTK